MIRQLGRVLLTLFPSLSEALVLSSGLQNMEAAILAGIPESLTRLVEVKTRPAAAPHLPCEGCGHTAGLCEFEGHPLCLTCGMKVQQTLNAHKDAYNEWSTVKRFYQDRLGRMPTDDEIEQWLSRR